MPTILEHITCDYTGLNVYQVEGMDCIDYLQYRRDAFISYLNKTEAGREHLKNAITLEQTEPDRKRLRELF